MFFFFLKINLLSKLLLILYFMYLCNLLKERINFVKNNNNNDKSVYFSLNQIKIDTESNFQNEDFKKVF